ncbi:MAG: carboxypeptidase-like regulatory domain-containing protein [Planctomycetaceae bacterium]|jgi:hypothetical protein|nr:carboxypeptidase-like regulatory domain-containing protein [Planctomycetaceae bacterium]
MKTLFSKFFVCVLCTLISIIGCGKPSNIPIDFPKIYPCEITVVQDGKPLENAMVSFRPIGDANKYAKGCSAVTDANGKALMVTYGQNGVPTGIYKVLISKLHDEGGIEVEDNFGSKSIQGAKVYSYIDVKYSDEKLTPYEIEIKEQKEIQKLQCDVGTAIRQYIRDTTY